MKKFLTIVIAALAICSSCEEKQDGGDERTAATLTVTPASIPAVATAGTYALTVTSNTSWTATVEEAATHGWCTIINGAQGSENGAITLQTVQNTVVEERYATITVAAGTLTRQVTVTQAAAAPVLEVDKTAIPAAIAAATYSIGVTSNLTWAATVNSAATWCTLTNAGATGNGTVTVNVAENPAIETRSATVTVTSGTLTRTVAVTQADAAPALAVDKTTIAATVNAASYDVSVTSNSTWTAALNSAATWCTLTNAGATGNGTVTVNVAENPTIETRAATVTVTSGTLTRTVAVTQADAAPALAVDKTTIPAVASAATYSIGVTSNLTWAAAVNSAATWCTLTNANASGNGTVTVNVAANPTIETRAATVTIRAGTLTRKVAVTQSGATPALAVDKATIPAGAAAATYSIGVTSNLTWMATVNSAATWCTLANASGSGNGTVTVNVAKNTVAATRSATVTVASGSLTRTVTVTQDVLTAPPYAASTQTWKFGGQKWSDAIHMPGCDKTSFNQSTTEPDCRSYSSNGNTWYYYNWPYVAANASTLCPAPWRVPSMRDFQTLANNASRVQLMTAWRRGGHMMTNHEPYDLGDRVELWSTTSLNDQEASMMYVDGGYCYTYVNGTPVPCPLFVAGTDKYLGDAVQCVIDW